MLDSLIQMAQLNGLHEYAHGSHWLQSICNEVTMIKCREEGFINIGGEGKDIERAGLDFWEHEGYWDGDLGTQIQHKSSCNWDIHKIVQKRGFLCLKWPILQQIYLKQTSTLPSKPFRTVISFPRRSYRSVLAIVLPFEFTQWSPGAYLSEPISWTP